MADFSPVSPGVVDNLPTESASWINAVSQAAAAYHNQSALSNSKGSKPVHSVDRSSAKVKNETGSDLERGHYVQLGEFELDDRDPRKLWFEGNLYDEASEQRIAIVTNAVLNGSRVDAVLIGIAVAVVDVTDTGHRFAAPVDGEFVLTSAESGPVEILDTVTETGEQECAVAIGSGGGGGGDTLRRILVSGNVPACTFEVVDLVLTVTPGFNSTGGYFLEDMTAPDLITEAPSWTAGDPVALLNWNAYPILTTVPDPEDTSETPTPWFQGYTVVFGRAVNYTVGETNLTAYEIVPYDFTGGQYVKDGDGLADGLPEALYHAAGVRGLLWGNGECG